MQYLDSPGSHRLSALIYISRQVWRCDEISFVLQSTAALQQSYPQCAQAGDSLAGVRVAIRAAVNGDKLGLGSSVRATWGMSMWIAIVIHALGVETYVRTMEDPTATLKILRSESLNF
jgi:nitroreductase